MKLVSVIANEREAIWVCRVCCLWGRIGGRFSFEQALGGLACFAFICKTRSHEQHKIAGTDFAKEREAIWVCRFGARREGLVVVFALGKR